MPRRPSVAASGRRAEEAKDPHPHGGLPTADLRVAEAGTREDEWTSRCRASAGAEKVIKKKKEINKNYSLRSRISLIQRSKNIFNYLLHRYTYGYRERAHLIL
jgi:hypothetical protein